MTLRPTDYAALSQDSYKDPVLNQSIKIGGVEYTPIAYANDPHTGFQATAYDHKDANGAHEVVIAYRGTEFDREPVHDGGVDAGMVALGVNAQTPDSIAFTQHVITQAQERAKAGGYALDISVTGHSLGGTLAEINAHHFKLHGDTFNAYGSAGLAQGIPAGGNQVIDYVRATDVVSAASPHFGEVRTYATQEDIDHLSQVGYRNNSGLLSPRDPVAEIRRDAGDAHAIAHFAPDKNGNTILTQANLALAHHNQHMISRYRDDIGDARLGVSTATGATTTALTVDGLSAAKDGLSKAATAAEQSSVRAYETTRETVVHETQVVHEKIVEGLLATEHAAQYAENKAVNGYHGAVDATSRGIEATVHAAQYAEHETVEGYRATVGAASRGIEATVHGTQYVAHETVKGYDAVVDVTSRGIEATAYAAEHVAKEVSQSTQAGAAAVGEAYAQKRPDSWSAHPPMLNDPAHPDHRLFQQAYDGVKKLDAEHGRAPDNHSLNLAGALTVESKARGLRQIDVVALSEDGANAFAVEKDGRIGSTSFARVDTVQAVHAPIEHSSQQMVQVNQQLQQQAQQQQIQQQAAQVNLQQAGPGMAR
jgi:hypothetical protein